MSEGRRRARSERSAPSSLGALPAASHPRQNPPPLSRGPLRTGPRAGHGRVPGRASGAEGQAERASSGPPHFKTPSSLPLSFPLRTGRGRGLARGLGGQLLAGGLAARGLAGRLLRASHVERRRRSGRKVERETEVWGGRQGMRREERRGEARLCARACPPIEETGERGRRTSRLSGGEEGGGGQCTLQAHWPAGLCVCGWAATQEPGWSPRAPLPASGVCSLLFLLSLSLFLPHLFIPPFSSLPPPSPTLLLNHVWSW